MKVYDEYKFEAACNIKRKAIRDFYENSTRFVTGGTGFLFRNLMCSQDILFNFELQNYNTLYYECISSSSSNITYFYCNL